MSSLRAQRSNPETAKTEWIASSQELLAMTGVGFPERTGIEMTGAETLDVARDAIWTIIVVSSPLMIVGLVVGVVVSLFQALTQIQDQTLVFFPKLLPFFWTLLLP